MDETREKTSQPIRERSLWRFVLWPMVVLFFYVLSLEPADRFIGASSAVRGFYAPVIWTHQHVRLFREALDTYMGFWDKN
jgi:hypothetical protein